MRLKQIGVFDPSAFFRHSSQPLAAMAQRRFRKAARVGEALMAITSLPGAMFHRAFMCSSYSRERENATRKSVPS